MAEGGRCDWCGTDPLYVAYHDDEWGRPDTDPRTLWEKLILDGFQAGLAWITILRKRESFRAAFDGFDPEKVARYGEADIARLLGDAGIVRHRGKIEATIGNARAYLAIQEREADLVVGTHGRAAYVLDDIRPLRGLDADVLAKPLHLFEIPDAQQHRIAQTGASRFPGATEFRGQIERYGASISFSVNGEGVPHPETDEAED